VQERTKRTRIMVCSRCGFRADRDEVPLHWALKLIKAHKHLPNSSSIKKQGQPGALA